MSYNHLRSRIKSLEQDHPEPGPWPPESGLGKIFYDELIEQGIDVQPPPKGESPIIHLLKLCAEDAFKDDERV